MQIKKYVFNNVKKIIKEPDFSLTGTKGEERQQRELHAVFRTKVHGPK